MVAIAGGNRHSLALKSDGTVVAWGSDFYGQSAVPVGLIGVVAIACGEEHSLILQGSELSDVHHVSLDGKITGLSTISSSADFNLVVRDRRGVMLHKSLSLTVDPNPNTRPEISAVSPSSGALGVPENQNQNFVVSALDPEGQPLTYIWKLDGEVVGGNQNSFDFSTAWGGAGSYILEVEVQDDLWNNGMVTQSWQISVPTDNDEDGQSNLEEVEAGMDPDDPNSFFSIENSKFQKSEDGDELVIRFPTRTNRIYKIFVSNQLGSWPTTPGQQLSGDGNIAEVLIPIEGQSIYFIRVQVQLISP